MSPRLPSRPVAVAAVFLALLPTATDLSGQVREQPRPSLGGHTFIWNPATMDPFPRTFIRNTTGIGRTRERVLIPPIEIGDTVLSEVRGELLFAELDFTYQHEIRDWLAGLVEFQKRIVDLVPELARQRRSSAVRIERI